MTCTEQQIKTLMKYARTHSLSAAAAKACMSLESARKYFRGEGQMPPKKERDYRTREDGFADAWSDIEEMLRTDPGLQGQTIMDMLIEGDEQKYSWGQLRSLQRRIRKWRALNGPEKNMVFPQNHIPGKQSQSDWTWCTKLGVTISGQEYKHSLFHFMLPYSRWEIAFISNAESFENLTMGYIRAVTALGKVAKEHRTDNLTAAVNNHGSKHVFQERWSSFMAHYGVTPTMNNSGECHENGSVEKSHDLLKNALAQALKLRKSKDFTSVEEYESFIERIVKRRNQGRKSRLEEELRVMKALPKSHWSDPTECWPTVTSFSTISVAGSVYSVPTRFIAHELKALVYPETIRVFLGDTLVQEMPHLARGSRKINYRHVVAQLLRKPGAFANYQYRDELFPAVIFRQAYDVLKEKKPQIADKEYLGVLNLAATVSEQDVMTALTLLLDAMQLPLTATVRELVKRNCPTELPPVHISAPEISCYDSLFSYLARAPKEVNQ